MDNNLTPFTGSDWSFPEVTNLPYPDYENRTYPDSDMSILTSFKPILVGATYADYLDWVVINDTKHGQTTLDGVAYWGNGELDGCVSFWGERGMKIMCYGQYGENNVYWKIPDDYTMYDRWICKIDLVNHKATCRGVIPVYVPGQDDPTYTNPLTYTLSDHEYEMECNYIGGMVP